MTALAPLLQGFFTQRLAQRRASPATVAAYRDSFRLLLRFASERAGKAPSALEVSDMDAETVSAFLDHLETARDNGVRAYFADSVHPVRGFRTPSALGKRRSGWPSVSYAPGVTSSVVSGPL